MKLDRGDARAGLQSRFRVALRSVRFAQHALLHASSMVHCNLYLVLDGQGYRPGLAECT